MLQSSCRCSPSHCWQAQKETSNQACTLHWEEAFRAMLQERPLLCVKQEAGLFLRAVTELPGISQPPCKGLHVSSRYFALSACRSWQPLNLIDCQNQSLLTAKLLHKHTQLGAWKKRKSNFSEKGGGYF